MNQQMKLSDWKVDNSAGRPILTYKGCSVIEAEDAEFVLSAIKATLSAPVLNVPEQAQALTSHEIDFCLLVFKSPGARLDDEGQARHWEDDGSEYGQIFSHWHKPEELGLIECVGGYKWVPTDKLKSMVRAALAGPQQPAPPVAVKPLRWSEEQRGDYSFVEAETSFGKYRIDWKHWKELDARFPDVTAPDHSVINYAGEGLDAAKAAAQTDYEARILSALSGQVQDEAETTEKNKSLLMFRALKAAWNSTTVGTNEEAATALMMFFDAIHDTDQYMVPIAFGAWQQMRMSPAGDAGSEMDLAPLEIRLQKLITENPEKARLASSREDLRMWFIAELISEASGRIPLLEIEGLVSRQLAAGKGGDA